MHKCLITTMALVFTMLLASCATVTAISPVMGASGPPAYWIEVANGPRENALEKVRLTGEALCKGRQVHIAREIEEDREMTYLLRALVQCDI